MLMMYFLFIIQIWLTGVQCNGSENSIFDCTHQPWGNTGCTEAKDAGVICTSMLIIIHAHSLCVLMTFCLYKNMCFIDPFLSHRYSY